MEARAKPRPRDSAPRSDAIAGWRKVEELFRRTRDLRLAVTLPKLEFMEEGEACESD